HTNTETSTHNRINLMHNLTDLGTLANDPLEIHLAADFLFKIKLLLRELVPEFSDLAISQGVLDRNRYLTCDLTQELDFIATEVDVLSSAQGQDTQRTISADKRHQAT